LICQIKLKISTTHIRRAQQEIQGPENPENPEKFAAPAAEPPQSKRTP
jgi:hypothetical protein